jgi:hypothetical protein
MPSIVPMSPAVAQALDERDHEQVRDGEYVEPLGDRDAGQGESGRGLAGQQDPAAVPPVHQRSGGQVGDEKGQCAGGCDEAGVGG